MGLVQMEDQKDFTFPKRPGWQISSWISPPQTSVQRTSFFVGTFFQKWLITWLFPLPENKYYASLDKRLLCVGRNKIRKCLRWWTLIGQQLGQRTEEKFAGRWSRKCLASLLRRASGGHQSPGLPARLVPALVSLLFLRYSPPDRCKQHSATGLSVLVDNSSPGFQVPTRHLTLLGRDLRVGLQSTKTKFTDRSETKYSQAT